MASLQYTQYYWHLILLVATVISLGSGVSEAYANQLAVSVNKDFKDMSEEEL